MQDAMVKKVYARKSGMTLLEVVISITISVLLIGSMYVAILALYRYQDDQIKLFSNYADVQKTLDKLVSFLREARYSNVGHYPIYDFSTSSVVFFSNIDDDPDVERVRVFLQDSTLSMAVTNPVFVNRGYEYPSTPDSFYILLDDVIATSTPIFSFFNDEGDLVTNVDEIMSINFVKIQISSGKFKSGHKSYRTFYSSATLRNTK